MTIEIKAGDRVRRIANRSSKAYEVGHEPFVVQSTTSAGWGDEGWVRDPNGQLHDSHNLEFAPEPEAPRQPKVGDRVRLVGDGWGQLGYPPAGTIVNVTIVDESGMVSADGGAMTITGARGERYHSYRFEFVDDEPEESGLDATGYPVGTPRAEKDIPETSQIKGTYQETGETPADKAALLAEFNRWYEREIAEARAEGHAEGRNEGFKAGFEQRGEFEAADLQPWERELLGLGVERPGFKAGYREGANAVAQTLVDNLLHGLEIPE